MNLRGRAAAAALSVEATLDQFLALADEKQGCSLRAEWWRQYASIARELGRNAEAVASALDELGPAETRDLLPYV